MEDFEEQVDFLSEQMLLHGLNFSRKDIEETLRVLQSIMLKLIVTNVPREVYTHEVAKHIFEDVFKRFDPKSTFIYLPSFSRALVYMTEPSAALCARLQTDGWTLPPTLTDMLTNQSFSTHPHSGIHCFIDQIDDYDVDLEETESAEECTCQMSGRQRVTSEHSPSPVTITARDEPWNRTTKSLNSTVELENTSEASGDDTVGTSACPRHGRMKYLPLPKPPRLFLLSPPTSPPVGWEPKPESEPIINYELLEALASLAPGEPFELHPSDRDRAHPSIVITPCDNLNEASTPTRSVIVRTPCPQRSSDTCYQSSTTSNS